MKNTNLCAQKASGDPDTNAEENLCHSSYIQMACSLENDKKCILHKLIWMSRKIQEPYKGIQQGKITQIKIPSSVGKALARLC